MSIDQLMDEVWSGKVVNKETVTKRVEMVRAALGDDPQEPRYIALVRGHGYRLLVAVGEAAEREPADEPREAGSNRGLVYLFAGAPVLVLGYLGLDRFAGKDDVTAVTRPSGDPSIAVLPFAHRSARQEDAFFVDGVHDDLLTYISRIGCTGGISSKKTCPWSRSVTSLNSGHWWTKSRRIWPASSMN